MMSSSELERSQRSQRIGVLLDVVEAHASPWGPVTGVVLAAAEAAALAGDVSELGGIVETLRDPPGPPLLVSGGVSAAGASR